MSKIVKYKEFLKKLKIKNINFTILDRRDFLSKSGGDLDIFVSSIYKFEKFLKASNVKIIQKLEHHYGAINYYLLFKDELLNIDIYELYVVNFKLIFPSSFFSKNKIFIDGLPFLSKEAWCKYYLVKKIIKMEGLTKLKDCDIENIINSDSYLKKVKEDILKIKKTTNREEILKVRKKLLKVYPVCKKALFYEPIRIFKRIIKPTGKVIAFLGPDGVGKSTIIKYLEKDTNLPFRRVRYFHLMPRVLNYKRNKIPVSKPHAKQPYKGIKSYLKLFYFLIEYILGYWIKVYPAKVKSTLVLFDRYYDDLLVDPIRYRYGGNLKIALFLSKLIPKPDIYIVLIADPKTIFSRKQELSYDTIRKQIELYKMLCKNRKNCFKVLATKKPEDVVKDIKKILYTIMQEE